jgi:hypothetical protein
MIYYKKPPTVLLSHISNTIYQIYKDKYGYYINFNGKTKNQTVGASVLYTGHTIIDNFNFTNKSLCLLNLHNKGYEISRICQEIIFNHNEIIKI